MRLALILLLATTHAAAQDATLGALPFALPVGERPAPPPVVGKPLPGQDLLMPESRQTNFEYGQISNRLKKIIIGRPLKFHGDVRVGDRVDNGAIKWIVLHSAMGSCRSAINTMETPHEASSHFIVCKDGGVTRLVDINNIPLHVKNAAINDASVGIETETGRLKGGYAPDDWDPAAHWKMFASLAWLIRAVAEETGVKRSWGDDQTPGVIGHLEADEHHKDDRGRRDGHTDPGPDFYHKRFASLDARFPGEAMTAQKYLMLLVGEDQPPSIEKADANGAVTLRVSDSARAGLAKVVLLRDTAQLQAWKAPEKGLPPAVVELPAPAQPGAYDVEAYDLVGNLTKARLIVAGPQGATELTIGDQ